MNPHTWRTEERGPRWIRWWRGGSVQVARHLREQLQLEVRHVPLVPIRARALLDAARNGVWGVLWGRWRRRHGPGAVALGAGGRSRPAVARPTTRVRRAVRARPGPVLRQGPLGQRGRRVR